MEDIKDIIGKRICGRIKPITEGLISILGAKFKFIVAGNSLNKDIPNDFDLYADKGCEFNFENIKKQVSEVLSETINALTVKINDTVVQFCKYKKDSIQELVDSFDFAHIQIGASFEIKEYIESTDCYIVLQEVYISDNWEQAKLLETTFYTKPEVESSFPMSSMIRAFKYKERGNFGDGSYIAAVFAILNQFLNRGFANYKDFKDQLAAVDLAMLDEFEGNVAWELYQTCVDKGLVKDPDAHEDLDFDFDLDL